MQRVLLDLEDDTGSMFPARGVPRVVADEDRGSIVNNWADGHDNNRPREFAPTRRKRHRKSEATVSRRKLGPYSRLHSIWEVDLRTKEAQLMLRVREELTDHVGGNPNAVERLLIERATMLALKCSQIDYKIMSGEALTTHDQTHALAWNNGLRRCLVDLGIEPRTPVTNGGGLTDWAQSHAAK